MFSKIGKTRVPETSLPVPALGTLIFRDIAALKGLCALVIPFIKMGVTGVLRVPAS